MQDRPDGEKIETRIRTIFFKHRYERRSDDTFGGGDAPPQKEDEVLSIGKSAGYKTKVRDMMENRENEALRCKVDNGEHLKI